MTDNNEAPAPSNWCDDSPYEAMLALDRRGWAWRCLQRNVDFAALAADLPAPVPRILRPQPLIATVALSWGDRLAPWGLHFRGGAGPTDGPCRLAG